MALGGAAVPALPHCGEGCADRSGAVGGYIRHNQLWREVRDLSDTLLEEQYLCTNDAIMMYSPCWRLTMTGELNALSERAGGEIS